LKVLVVDDDRRMVKTTCDILSIKGFEAVAAFSGEEVLEKLKNGAPDCVLMDIKMPGMTGVETLKRIKHLYPALPVILASAYATDEVIEEAKRQGAYAVLTKPINFQVILSFLSALRKHESILIVDDDPNFCRTLKDMLALKGYRIETETDPARVLGHMENNYKLVVLLDLKLGSVDGMTVLKEIREKFPSKPVVLMTGYRGEMHSFLEKGVEIDAYACLYKPLEMESLVTLIEEIRRDKYQVVLGGE
jgi:DNA-binding NtrC family response regulator